MLSIFDELSCCTSAENDRFCYSGCMFVKWQKEVYKDLKHIQSRRCCL